MMAFITFKGINAGVCDGFYPTQALANAAATDNDDIVAHVGSVEVGNLQPNKAYWDGTDLMPETPESVMLSAMSDGDYATMLKRRTALTAITFDRGLKFHWAVNSAAANSKALHQILTEDNTEKLDNTIDWGRSWVGYPWRLTKRFEAGESDALSRADLEAKVKLGESELPNENHILVWYEIHDSFNWRNYMDMRKIFRTVVNNGIGGGLQEDGGTLGFTEPQWEEMLTDFYEEALTLGALMKAGLA